MYTYENLVVKLLCEHDLNLKYFKHQEKLHFNLLNFSYYLIYIKLE